MKRDTDHKPRAYSTMRTIKTWRNGVLEHVEQLVWVYPEDKPLGKTPNMRSRLETDAEVRARLQAATGESGWGVIVGKGLDAALEHRHLPPRGWVDEVV